MRNEDSILLKLIFYAENDPRVRAMVLFGSRAREEKKADRFSDYDLIFFVSDVDYFVHSDEWLRGIAEPGISFFENTAVQDYERRVFFDDAMDMDFLFYNVKDVERITADPIIRAWYAKGHRILVDKIHYEKIVEASRPAPMMKKAVTEEELRNSVNNFWFHTIWATKKLQRGEIWASASVRSALQDAYGKYDRESLQLALAYTMDLYATAAQNTARLMNCLYPAEAEEYARRSVEKVSLSKQVLG